MTMTSEIDTAKAGPLDVDVIVGAAREIVERESLASLTMRRLGRELDVEAMSIYHHIPNKHALLNLVAVSVLTPMDEFEASPSPYDTIGEFCRRLRSLLIGHAELAPLVVNDSIDVVLASRGAAVIWEQLIEAGFDPAATRWILQSFVGFAAGHVMVEIAQPSDDGAAFETGLRFMLAGLREELGD